MKEPVKEKPDVLAAAIGTLLAALLGAFVGAGALCLWLYVTLPAGWLPVLLQQMFGGY